MRLQAKNSLGDDCKKGDGADDDAKETSSIQISIPKKTAKIPKPAWALTEKAAEEADEEKDLIDGDELIEFAKNLDFDKYIDDMEIQTMIARVKQRIGDLEKDYNNESSRLEESEHRLLLRNTVGEKKVMLNWWMHVTS